MKKVLLLFGIVSLMSACAGNTKTRTLENDSIVIIKEASDTIGIDTLDVDSLIIDNDIRVNKPLK